MDTWDLVPIFYAARRRPRERTTRVIRTHRTIRAGILLLAIGETNNPEPSTRGYGRGRARRAVLSVRRELESPNP